MNDPAATPSEHAAIRLIVKGRVQGVGFRHWVLVRGRHLSLAGVVRNLPDGSVEVLAEGPTTTLRQLLAAVSHGPPGARVEGVDATWDAPRGILRDFEIGY